MSYATTNDHNQPFICSFLDGGHQKKIFEQKTIRGVGETEAVKIVSRKSHQLSF